MTSDGDRSCRLPAAGNPLRLPRPPPLLAGAAVDRARRSGRFARRLRDARQAHRAGARRPDLLQRGGEHAGRVDTASPTSATVSQTAEHPPLTALVLTPTSWVMEQFDPGGNDLLAQRLTMTVFGAGCGVADRADRPRGGRTSCGALSAAVIAAIYPNLWVNDGLVMSRDVGHPGGRARHPPRVPVHPPSERGVRRVRVGLARGLAMLARAELGLLLASMVLPVVLFLRALSFKRQIVMFVVACLAAGLVVSPWLVANLTRFDEPVFFSTNDGLTLCGANLPPHLLRPGHRAVGTGLRRLPGAERRPLGGVERVAQRRPPLHPHAPRAPPGGGRGADRGGCGACTWPGMMASYNQNEGRETVGVVGRVLPCSGCWCRWRSWAGCCCGGDECPSRRWSRSS